VALKNLVLVHIKGCLCLHTK